MWAASHSAKPDGGGATRFLSWALVCLQITPRPARIGTDHKYNIWDYASDVFFMLRYMLISPLCRK